MEDKVYWERIRQNLQKFWKPGDILTLIDIVPKKGQICGFCGKTPITDCYVLKNRRTSEKIIIGSKCYRNFWKETYKLNSEPVVRCSRKLSSKGIQVDKDKIVQVHTV